MKIYSTVHISVQKYHTEMSIYPKSYYVDVSKCNHIKEDSNLIHNRREIQINHCESEHGTTASETLWQKHCQ